MDRNAIDRGLFMVNANRGLLAKVPLLSKRSLF